MQVGGDVSYALQILMFQYLGYECIRNTERPFCTDVDECTDGREWATGLPHCGENTFCVNSVGSFECKCNPGWDVFQGGAGCVTDINECTDGRSWATGLPYCGSNTDCTNNIGSFSCACKVGYQNWVENSGCSDIDECGLAPTADYCGANAYCSNSVGSFSCPCDTGYENHNPNEGCSDIDECVIGTGQSYCGTNKGAVCFNNVGSFTCGCQDGYTNWSANTGETFFIIFPLSPIYVKGARKYWNQEVGSFLNQILRLL